jgi:hypothetical protein
MNDATRLRNRALAEGSTFAQQPEVVYEKKQSLDC